MKVDRLKVIINLRLGLDEEFMGDYSYVISLDDESRMIRLVVKGEISKSEGERIIVEARNRAAENEYDILCDLTDASIKATMADWFYLVRNKEIYPSIPTEKTAILVSPESWKSFKFIENVTRNVGLKIRIFLQEEDALEFLKKGE